MIMALLATTAVNYTSTAIQTITDDYDYINLERSVFNNALCHIFEDGTSPGYTIIHKSGRLILHNKQFKEYMLKKVPDGEN